MKKFGLMIAGLMFLAACSDNNKAEPAAQETAPPAEQEVATEQQDMTEEGFITQVTTDKILVNNIYFDIPEDVAIRLKNGEESKDGVISDIRTGMKVNIEYKGPLAEGFPMEAQAEVVSILNDSESKEESEALLAFIEEEQLPRLLMLGQPLVRDNKIGFLFTNMENGKMSEVKIDLDTHEYTIGGE
ncbi:MAG TPA: hypothetical protein VLQ20_13725 [Planococcus sp. (in: firmicutes)]|nr:hypothetical protein [Planococcus sp. (in: firmicutes)]